MHAVHITCETVRQQMPQYIAGKLDSGQADALIRHALRCPSCRAEVWDPFQARLEDCAEALGEKLLALEVEESSEEAAAFRSAGHCRSAGPTPQAASTWDDLGTDHAPAEPPSREEESADVRDALVKAVLMGNQASTTEVAGAFSPPQTVSRHANRPDAASPFWLEHVGTYLPAIPGPERYVGYTLGLMSDGSVRAGLSSSARVLELARLTVRTGATSLDFRNGFPASGASGAGRAAPAAVSFDLEALAPGLVLDGESLPVGEVVRLRGYHAVEGHQQAFTLRLEPRALPGTLGFIETLPRRVPLLLGDSLVGRAPQAEVPLPDGSQADPAHLIMKPARPEQQAPETALENLGVSREHVRILITLEGARVTPLSRHPIWLSRGDTWRSLDRSCPAQPLSPGNSFVAGRQCFVLCRTEHEAT